MKRSKIVFLGFALVFLGIMLFFSLDFSSKTTFPGKNPYLKEKLKQHFNLESDSIKGDSL